MLHVPKLLCCSLSESFRSSPSSAIQSITCRDVDLIASSVLRPFHRLIPGLHGLGDWRFVSQFVGGSCRPIGQSAAAIGRAVDRPSLRLVVRTARVAVEISISVLWTRLSLPVRTVGSSGLQLLNAIFAVAIPATITFVKAADQLSGHLSDILRGPRHYYIQRRCVRSGSTRAA